MPTAAQERSVLGRIWDAQTRIQKLQAQRAELLEGISTACLAGNIERAFDCAEATTRLDVQIDKARADLELWRSLR
jgi:hypothetical protein